MRKLQNSRYFWFILIIFLLYFSPYFVMQKNSHILIHDNLNQINMQGIFDGRFNTDFFLEDNVNDYTLPGTHSLFHFSHLKIDKLFFRLDYFWGFVINEIFYRILALLGMYFLLHFYIIKNKLTKIQIILISLAFSTLPFWPQGNLSIAGMPLLLFAFLNLYYKKFEVISWLIICFFPFYSNFFLSGFFICIIILVFLITSLFRKKISFPILFALIMLFVLYAISNYPIILNELIYKIPTNRTDQILHGLNFWRTIKTVVYNFFSSQPLAHSFQAVVIAPFCIFILSVSFLRKDVKMLKMITPYWIGISFVAISSVFFFWQPILDFYNQLEIGFRYDRIYVFKPILWFLLFAVSNKIFQRYFPKQNIILIILLISQLVINFYSYTWKAFTIKPTFRQFFSQDQFHRIRESLPEKSKDIRLGCIGFFPAVANYNGFKTVDSFSSYYPLEYKNKFGKIILPELNKNSEIKQYFENKGSALFLFDDEIAFDYYDQDFIRKNIHSITCDLDLDEMKKFGVEYIFSTAEIKNSKEKNLAEIYYDKNINDFYNMHIYKLNGGKNE